ncbi:hypothetical protein DH2020_015666 [Rehmannia glutinosa]|uniref:Myb/SANT-like domain-containing protein n=1 Tax=Rehmannia glutinosa TaxID=99300 RepID=A0ABR0WWV2_REHGL
MFLPSFHHAIVPWLLCKQNITSYPSPIFQKEAHIALDIESVCDAVYEQQTVVTGVDCVDSERVSQSMFNGLLSSERSHCKWLEIRKWVQNWLPSSFGARNAKDNTWGTDLKGIPHINSKIHVWKKDYGSLVTMLSRRGIGWNVTTNMIEARDDAWKFEYVKVDANARLMRNKSWPFSNDWVMIFGKDRATGEHAEDFTDALNHVLNGQSTPQDDYHVNLENLSDNCEYETETNSNCQAESTPQMSTSGKKGAGGKRKSTDGVDPLYEIMKTFCQSTEARLGDIAKRIGYEYDISFARKEVFGVVGNMQGLSLRDKLLVSKLLVKNTEDLELFFSLPDEARVEFARMKLSGSL